MTYNSKLNAIFLLLLISVVAIQQIAYKDTEISGKFIVAKIGSILPAAKISVTIDSLNLSIVGCNTLVASYYYNLPTKAFSCNPFTSTRKYCDVDQDDLVSKAFGNCRKASRQGSAMVCEDGSGYEVIRLQVQAQNNINIDTSLPANNQIINTLISNSPAINVASPIFNSSPNTSDNAQPNVISFLLVNGPLETSQKSITTETKTQTIITTTTILPAISSSSFSFSSSSSSSSTSSQNNSVLPVIVINNDTKSSQEVYQKIDISQLDNNTFKFNSSASASIVGKYDLVPTAYQLAISQNIYTLTGCNTHTFIIEYLPNNAIKFNLPTSTRKFCQYDFDSYYLQAFSLARYLLPVDKGYRILDENSKLILEIASVKNSFLISVPSVSLTVDNYTLNYEGCNIQSTDYTLTGGYSIAIGQTASTLRSCLFFDYDSYIVQSLQLANNFQISSKALVFKADDLIVAFAFTKSATVANINNNNNVITSSAPITISIPQLGTPVFVPTPICTPVSDNDIQVIPAPPIALPGISSQSLKGVYRLQPLAQSNLSSIIITVDDEYIQFESCNLFRVPYSAYSDGTFTILQGSSSTVRQCVVDNDSQYISTLRSINRFVKSEGGYVLLTDNTIVANLPNKLRNQIVKYSVIYGGYQVAIAGIDATVANGVISFQGCNSISIPYILSQNATISFGSVTSTKIYCPADVDGYYTTAITASKTVQALPDGYALIDERGIERIRLVSFGTLQQCNNADYLSGAFKLQLPSSAMRLTISDGVFSLAGCNEYTFKFSLSDNGSIIYSTVSSPGKQCNIDFDKVYLYALLKSQSVALNDKTIIFYNGNKQEVFKAINFEMSKPVTEAPILLDNSNPIVKVLDFKLVEGSYKFSILRSSLKVLPLTVSNKTVSFKGCNTVGMNYTASSDGNITFKFVLSTKIGCAADYDSFYIDALASVRKYSEMKGMYTFFDDKGKSVVSFVADYSIASLVGSTPATPAIVTTPVVVKPPTVLPVLPTVIPPLIPAPSTLINQSVVLPPLVAPKVIPPKVVELGISLKGLYQFQLPQISFEIFQNSFLFKGCNTYRIPCAYKSNSIFLGNPISTAKKCDTPNFDNYFLNLISSVSNFRKDKSSFTFYNSKLQSLFSAGLNIQNAKNFNNIPGLSSGSYDALIPTIDVQFDDQSFAFSGCKQNILAYNAKNTGSILFAQPKIKKSCSIPLDDIFFNAVKGSNKWKKTQTGFSLHDNYGNAKCICSLKK